MFARYNMQVLRALEKYAGCSYADIQEFDEKMIELEEEFGMKMVLDQKGTVTGLFFNDEKKYIEFVLRWY